MNNCPKCGNPLQVGTASCPICGTNIVKSAPVEQPTTQPAKVAVAPAPAAQPIAPAPAPVAPAPTPAQEAPVAPVTQTVQPAPVAPAQTIAPAPAAQPVAQAPAPVAEQAVPQPEAIAVDPNSIAPTVKPIEVGTPVPSIPASLNPDAPVQTVSVDATVKVEKNKKKTNKNVLIIAGILAIAVIAGVLMMNFGGGNRLNSNTNTNAGKNSSLITTAVSTNGFKFNLEEGWLITEDGSNVIVTNKDETVAIKLDYTKAGLETISKSTIEGFFSTRTDFTNTNVTETTISAKDAFLVNTQINQAIVQVYYINGGTNLTLGATIVYQSAETKTKYEANVTELIGSLSYSDESLKAISSMQMYSNIFGVYNGVFQYQPSQSTPVPEEQPQENPTPETPTE